MRYIIKSFECFGHYKKSYVISKILYILLNILSMLDYYFLSKMITNLLNSNFELFKKYLYVMILWNTGLIATRYVIDMYYAKLIVKINNTVKKNIFESYFSFYQFSQSNDSSKLNNVFINEYITPMSFLDAIFNYISEIILLLYILIVLVNFDIRFLYSLILIFPIIIVNSYFAKKIKFFKRKDYLYIDSIFGLIKSTTLFIYNIFSNVKVLYSINSDLDNKIKEKIIIVNDMNKNKLNLQYSIEIIVKLNMYVFYFIALNLIIRASMIVENFIFISFYIQKIIYSIISLTRVIPQLQMFYISLDRLFSILDKNKKFKKLEESKLNMEQINTLELRGASFIVNGKKIIDNANFIIKQEDKIIIRGKNGSGKSTLVKLLSLQYPITKGKLLFNDNLSDEYKVSSIFSNISVSSQIPCVMPLSFKDNISFESEKRNVDEIISDFELLELIARLPNGMDTIIDKNVELSGGEKKKIDLLRCISKNADLYIFDEPLAYLDSSFKIKFSFLVDKYLKNKAFIIVDHNEINGINFNREFFVEEGKVFCLK